MKLNDRFPISLFVLALALTAGGWIWLALIARDARQIAENTRDHSLRVEALCGSILHLDEVLTMSARMAAASGASRWGERYRRFEPQLDGAIQEAMKITSGFEGSAAAARTDEANRRLVEMENRGFALVRAGRQREAGELLAGSEYEAQKQIYAVGMAEMMDNMRGRLDAALAATRRKSLVATWASAAGLLVCAAMWVFVVGNLNYWRRAVAESAAAREQAVEELRLAGAQLEQRVEERTAALTHEIAERKAAEKKIAEADREMRGLSRQAGMAEVATSVLHNVGNVLNSVNVSVSVATDKVRGLKVATLERLAETLRGQQDLAAFLTSDSRGRELPAFLASVAERLGADRAAVLAELDGLRAHIEHVNEIVAMQQSYANACGVTEVLPLAGLIEDALRMNAGAIERHGLQIVRDYAELPPVPVDRHKVLQILVNLIRNAKYALDDGAPADKRLTLRLGLNGGGRAKITVSDNGVGIPAENLARIFGHGFTTRKGGHGFGLHSGANAARELGGFLTAHSDGPGRGATFTLELPIAGTPSGGEAHPGGEESPPYNPPAAGAGQPGEARVGRPFLAAAGPATGDHHPTTQTTHPGGEESPPYNTPTGGEDRPTATAQTP